MIYSFAKTEFSREPKPVDSLDGPQELSTVRIISGEPDDVSSMLADEPGRQPEEVGTDGVQRRGKILRRKTQSLEPVNEVGSEEQDLEEGDVGNPGVGGDLSQGVVVLQLPDVFLDRGPGTVEEVHPPSSHLEIRDEDVVGILPILEQRQLTRLVGIGGNTTPDDDKPVLPIHIVMNLLSELADLPTVSEFLKPTSLCSVSDVGIFPDHHHVAAPRGIQEPDDAASVKARVHPEPNPGARYGRGDLGQANLQERDRSGGGRCVARPQASVPELLEVRFETQEGVVRSPSRLLGVVSDPCPFGPSVDDEDGRIHIEDKRGALLRKRKQVGSQAVVQSGQLTDRGWRQTFEEPAQRGLIWKSPKSQQSLEGSVVLQDLGLADASQAHDDGEHQSQDQFGMVVFPASAGDSDIPLEQASNLELVAKTLDQPHPTEVGNMCFVEGKKDFSNPFGHVTQSTPMVTFVSRPLLRSSSTFFPGEIEPSCSKNGSFHA